MKGKIVFRTFATLNLLVIAGIALIVYKAGVSEPLFAVNATDRQTFPAPTASATLVYSVGTTTPILIFGTATWPDFTATVFQLFLTNNTIPTSRLQRAISTPTAIPTATPVPDQTSSFCRNKRPENLIFVNPNATFELLKAQDLKYGEQAIKTFDGGIQVLYSIQSDGRPGERVRCFNDGFNSYGKKIVACVGIVKMTYDLKICDSTRSGCVIYKLTLPHCPGNPSW